MSNAAAGRFSSYTGIDGKPLRAGPRSNVPFDFGPFEAEFSMDSIGKSGDKCPFLYSNRTCISQKNIFFASYYENGDALLIYPNLHNKSYGIRLLLTDSGHYLIPVSNFEKSPEERSQIQQANLHATKEYENMTKHLS